MNIRELLSVESLYQIVGIKQPEETCPIIDDVICEFRADIKSIENNIDLMCAIDDDKKAELESEILFLRDNIKYLEEDRRKIAEARKVGTANRNFIINLYTESIFEYKNLWFINEKKLSSYHSGLKKSDFGRLYTNNKQIIKNYELIIDWAIAWDSAMKSFLEKTPLFVTRMAMTEDQWYQFRIVIPKIIGVQSCDNEISQELMKQLQEIFPDIMFFENSSGTNVFTLRFLVDKYFSNVI